MVEMVIVTARHGTGKPESVTPRVTAWHPDPVQKIRTEEKVGTATARLVQRRERGAVKAAFNGHGDV